jgi:hypothetical protein
MKKRGLSSRGVVAAVLVGCCVGSLLSAAPEEKKAPKGKIEAGKAQYVAKNAEAWKTKGRLVGVAKQAPEFKVTVLAGEKREVKAVEAEKLKDGGRAYEVWLEPGTYTLVVSAAGYESLEIKNLEVKAGNDLRTDLEFTKAAE